MARRHSISLSVLMLAGLSGCSDPFWSWLPWHQGGTQQATQQNNPQAARQAALPASARAPYELVPPSLSLSQLHCEELLRVVRSFPQMSLDSKLEASYRFGLAFGYAIGFVSGADATYQGEVEIPSSDDYVSFAREVATQCTQQPSLNVQVAVVRKFEQAWVDRYYQARGGQNAPSAGTPPARQQQGNAAPVPGPAASAPAAPQGRSVVNDAWRGNRADQYWSRVGQQAQPRSAVR